MNKLSWKYEVNNKIEYENKIEWTASFLEERNNIFKVFKADVLGYLYASTSPEDKNAITQEEKDLIFSLLHIWITKEGNTGVQ